MSRPLASALVVASMLAVVAPCHARPVGYGDPMEPYPIPGEAPLPGTTNAPGSPASNAPAEPAWSLTSTLIAGKRRIAIINGRSVALGGTIDGARLVGVDGRGALIEVQGRRVRLDLPEFEGAAVTAKSPRGP